MTRNIITVTVLALASIGTASADSTTAEQLYDQGQTAFDADRFIEAASAWEQSYELSKEPGLLFNLGQAYRQLGECAKARTAYEKFLELDATSEQRPLAREFVTGLKCREPVAKPTLPVAPVVVEKPTPPVAEFADHGRTKRLAGLATAGGGAALLVTGIYLGHRAQTIGDQVADACRTSCDWAGWKDKDARGRRYATIGRVLDVGGVGAIAGGAVLYYLGVRQGTVTIDPRAQEGGITISWSGSW